MDTGKKNEKCNSIVPVQTNGMEIALSLRNANDVGERAMSKAENIISNYEGLFRYFFFYDKDMIPLKSHVLLVEKARGFVSDGEAKAMMDTMLMEYASVARNIVIDMGDDASALRRKLIGDDAGDRSPIGEELYEVLGSSGFSEAVDMLERLSHMPILDDDDESSILYGFVGIDENDVPKIKRAIDTIATALNDEHYHVENLPGDNREYNPLRDVLNELSCIYASYTIATTGLKSLAEVLFVLTRHKNMERLLNVDVAATSSKHSINGDEVIASIRALKGPIAAYEAALDAIRGRTDPDFIIGMAATAIAGLIRQSKSGVVVEINTVKALCSSRNIRYEDCHTLLEYLHKNEDTYLGLIRIIGERDGSEGKESLRQTT
ncbi:MAG: hypothetical protein M1504_04325 [Candidatus Marsarchaeota archaeon]|nr:hypothetical protein [Candidatus Marsarchaeota archaeon]